MTKTRPGVMLGTMEFGRGSCQDPAVAQQLVDLCLASPECRGLDTAYMYTGGQSETILGGLQGWQGVKPLDTKVNPWDGKGLGRASVRSQVETCLARLQVASVEIMYLHAPDHCTPLTETLGAMDEMYREGKFKQLGLSNYSSWLVNEVVSLCKANGWVRPTVYQGMYSAITRQVEVELIPCLRYHGIAFYAYSPLGGGILSGKYKFDQIQDNSISTGRFNGAGDPSMDPWKVEVYRGRYWKQEHFEAIEKLRELLAEHHPGEGVTVPGAALRWLCSHSLLDGSKGDCVLLGASKPEQLQMNLDLVTGGSLSAPVVSFLDSWWRSTMHLCPSYLR